MITKWNDVSADTETVLVVWIEDEANCSIPIEVLTFQFCEDLERSKGAIEETLEASWDQVMKFKKRAILNTRAMWGSYASVEAEAHYP